MAGLKPLQEGDGVQYQGSATRVGHVNRNRPSARLQPGMRGVVLRGPRQGRYLVRFETGEEWVGAGRLERA